MIKLTSEATSQILRSADETNAKGIALRVAVLIKGDGSYHYAIGFDDAIKDEDVRFNENGIDLVVSSESAGTLKGTTIDFVELEPGKAQFIFLNPNDPGFVPPVS